MEAKVRYRIFLSLFFFLSGFCFSTWASRIPTIKMNFALNDAQLGTILLAMPFSSLIGLPISGWLVTRYPSRVPLTGAFILNSVALLSIGFAPNQFILVAAVCVFAFSLRMLNISVNTQSLAVQKMYGRKINGSFHGVWSTGGIAGVGFSTLMVALNVPVNIHFALIACITLVFTIFFNRYLIPDDRASSGNKITIGKPDPFIFYLGILVFFAAMCEGGMFDWSGEYFRAVVREEIFTLGYLLFMVCMALSRFVSDTVIERMGIGFTYIFSGSMIMTGISVALLFPSFWPALCGFSMVGFGTGAVIPMTYSLAGSSRKYSPGMALSIIATYGVAGMLIGPPLIGYISEASDLRYSFTCFILSGFMLIPLSRMFIKVQNSEYQQDYKITGSGRS